MSARYVLTTPARNDTRDTVFEVDDRFGRAVAARVYGGIHETLARLADHPELGRTRPDR
jgi:plasmid stabilization system protein ParE